MRPALLAFGALLLCTTAAAPADDLLIDRISETRASGTDWPQRGTSMEQVRARHGEPESRTPAVGEPPITRWLFPGFTVYFEHDHVIHSVARR